MKTALLIFALVTSCTITAALSQTNALPSNDWVRVTLESAAWGHGSKHELVISNDVLKSWTYQRTHPIYNHVEWTLTEDRFHVWEKLKVLDVLNLPDQKSLPDDNVMTSCGVHYSVTIQNAQTNREYTYDNPQSHRRKEDQLLACIMDILNAPVARITRELSEKEKRSQQRVPKLTDSP